MLYLLSALIFYNMKLYLDNSMFIMINKVNKVKRTVSSKCYTFSLPGVIKFFFYGANTVTKVGESLRCDLFDT